MRSIGRQFRVFISSTFSDFKHEREALQERVFPKLRAYCESQGARFQAIDLRWGISEAAARDHQTVRICLEEIRRSQRLSPRPNFIMLLGDRYGWRPVPNEILADELEHLRQHLAADEQALIDVWYGRDDNAVPPVYYLRPRPTAMNDAGWEATQAHLTIVLRRAATTAGLPESERLKYFASATHLEASEGLLNIPDAGQHVFAYFRQIEGLPEVLAVTEATDFIDMQDGTRDAEAAAAQSSLKALIRTLLPDHTRNYRSDWLNGDISCDHIDNFCADIEADLKAVFDQELTQLDTADPLEWNAEQHQMFAVERARNFVGRQTELGEIAAYLDADSTMPLVVHGPGGVGKSALLAKAVAAIDAGGAVIIQRFIGATPESTQLRALLTGLCRELGRRYNADETVQYGQLEELFALFESRLEFANTEHPLMLILDSLDQLDTTDMAHQLQWLPQSLPPYVRVIASTRETQPEATTHPVYVAAERRYSDNLLALGPLTSDEGDTALDMLLTTKRSLTNAQREAVLRAFSVSGLPLFLKLAAETARQWHSYTPVPTLPATVPELIQNLIMHLQQPANHGPRFVERALAYLQAGRYGGLAEDELTRVLSLDAEVMDEFRSRALQPWNRAELPPIIWSRLHADLMPYLTEQAVDGALLYRFFHREFAEAVETNWLSGECGRARHTTLARAFEWHSDPAAFRKANESSVLRQMMELPHHLRCTEDADALKRLLTDFNFTFTKCAANRSDELVADFRDTWDLQIGGDNDFDVWVGFMRESAHLLRSEDPRWPAHKVLLQLAGEHADDSPLTRAAEAWLNEQQCDWLWFRSLQRPRSVQSRDCLAVIRGNWEGIIDAWVLPNETILFLDGSLQLCSLDGMPIGALLGHTDDVTGARIQANGHILSWCADGTLRLWTAEGVPLRTFEGHTGKVEGARILADGRVLSWSEDMTLRLWSAEAVPLSTLEGHTGKINGAEVLTDNRVLSWSEDMTLRLWSAEGAPLEILEGHSCKIEGVLALTDGRVLSWAKGVDQQSPQLWTVDGESLAVLEGHEGNVIGSMELNNGRILSWSDDCTLRLWTADGEPCAVLEGHEGDVTGAIELNDGRFLSWSDDMTLRLWTADGEPHAVLEGHEWLVTGALELNDGCLLSWSWDWTLRLWSPEGTLLKILEGHTNEIWGALELQQGRLLSWSNDGTLRIWSIEENSTPGIPARRVGILRGARILPNGRLLTWSNVGALQLWSREGELLKILEGHTKWVDGTELLTDGRILSWSADSSLRIWSSEGDSLAVLVGHIGQITEAIVLYDGHLLSWAQENSLRLWTSEGAPYAVLEGHTSWVNGAIQLKDGRILSWSSDHTLRLWTSDGNNYALLEGHKLRVAGAIALKDGRILSWSSDCTLRLWSSDGMPIAALEGHNNDVTGAIELDNGHLLSWSRDGTIRMWSDVGTPAGILAGHTDEVLGVRVLADARILSWSMDETLRLWSPDGEPLRVLEGHTWRVEYADVLANGCILSWSNDGALRLWSADGVPLQTLEDHANWDRGAQELPDGHILTWPQDGRMRLWAMSGQPHAAGEPTRPDYISSVVAASHAPYLWGLVDRNDVQSPCVWALQHHLPLKLQLYFGNQRCPEWPPNHL